MAKRIYELGFKIACLLPGTTRSSPFNRLRVFLLARLARTVGSGCIIRSGVIVNNPTNLEIGDNSGLGYRCVISCADRISIGSRVLMGADVIIYTSNHIWSEEAATYFGQGLTTSPVRIGDDVWLGARSIVLPGVSIGRGATVAAGAIVSRNVPEYAVVGGVPARIIKIKPVASEMVELAPESGEVRP